MMILPCTPSLRRGLATALALAAGLACSAAAAADPRYGSGCSFSGSTLTDGSASQSMAEAFCSGGTLEARGTTVVEVWTGDAYLHHSFEQYARTAVGATAGLGQLGAFSATTVASAPMAYEFYYSNGEPGLTENEYRAIAQSGISAYWYDEITVLAAPGAYGTVVLEFGLAFSADAQVLDGGRGSALANTRLIADDDRSSIDLQLSLAESGAVSDRRGYAPGTVIRIYGDLSASTRAEAGRIYLNDGGTRDGYIAESQAYADAMNTAGFTVDVVTEGAGYSTASGFSYVTPVPEPASGALLALGLGAVLGAARRRRAAAAADPA